jgi:hypothetical protein
VLRVFTGKKVSINSFECASDRAEITIEITATIRSENR